jgi:hypothetical protein
MLRSVSDPEVSSDKGAHTCQHLGRDVGTFWKVIRNGGERRPYCHKDSIHAQGSVVGVDTVPEKADKQADEDHEEREEEAERRTALYSVGDVQSGADDPVCGDQQRC